MLTRAPRSVPLTYRFGRKEAMGVRPRVSASLVEQYVYFSKR